MATLRQIAEDVAKFIGADEVLHDDGNVSVVVEDKGDFGFQIAQALGSLGVCVTVAVTGFRRYDRTPRLPYALSDHRLQGVLEMEISAYEHPTLNRDDPGRLTAQGVMERLAVALHGKAFATMDNPLLFKDFRRDDTDEANIVRGNFEANTRIGADSVSA